MKYEICDKSGSTDAATGGQRVLFDSLEEAGESVAHLEEEYPGSEWLIVEVTEDN